MNDLRAAAQQALEAMEYTGMDVGKFNRINAACAALKAALEEPVQEPVACHVFNVTVKGRLHEWEPTTFAFALRDGKHALYTAPPQRKPLTDEEIEKAYRHIYHNVPDGSYRTTYYWIEQGIRYAEEAHGIKGEVK